MESNKLLFPLPFRPTTQFVVGENASISPWLRKDRKPLMMTCLMCMVPLGGGTGAGRGSCCRGERSDLPKIPFRCKILYRNAIFFRMSNKY